MKQTTLDFKPISKIRASSSKYRKIVAEEEKKRNRSNLEKENHELEEKDMATTVASQGHKNVSGEERDKTNDSKIETEDNDLEQVAAAAAAGSSFNRTEMETMMLQDRESVKRNDDGVSSTALDSAAIEEIDESVEEKSPLKKKKHQALTPRHLLFRLLSRESQGVFHPSCRQKCIRQSLSQYRASPVQLDWHEDDQHHITALSFDKDGILLAAGSSDGVVKIFDFDEWQCRETERGNHAASQAEVDTVQLAEVHRIQVRHAVKKIKWNPANQDQVGICFSMTSDIYIYSFENALSHLPHCVLKSKSRPGTHQNDFVFMTEVQRGSKKRKSSILAVDQDGSIRRWMLKQPQAPLWVIPNLNVGAMTSLALQHSHLYCGSDRGYIVVYDILDIVTPAFTSKGLPRRLATWSLSKVLTNVASNAHRYNIVANFHAPDAHACGLMSLHFDPRNHLHLICQLRNEWLVVLDIETQRIVKLHTTDTVSLSSSSALASSRAMLMQAQLYHDPHVLSSVTNSHSFNDTSTTRRKYPYRRTTVGKFCHAGQMYCTAEEAAVVVVDLRPVHALALSNHRMPQTRTTITTRLAIVSGNGNMVKLNQSIYGLWKDDPKRIQIGTLYYKILRIDEEGHVLLIEPNLREVESTTDWARVHIQVYGPGTSAALEATQSKKGPQPMTTQPKKSKPAIARLSKLKIAAGDTVTAIETHPRVHTIVTGMVRNQLCVLRP